MKGHKRNINNFGPEKIRLLVTGSLFGFITGLLLISAFKGSNDRRWPIYQPISTATLIQRKAILHYATSKVVPQQTLEEITESFNVLQSLAPCNFLVFGLGYDSLMWASLNPNGTTLFLEESQEWATKILKEAPFLNAKTVSYRTHLRDADQLLETYLLDPDCRPNRASLKGNRHCVLALENLPEEVYEREWDVIMIDAPRGYAPDQPGRMAAIFSAAVMARERTRAGDTHVFLHDVNRVIEQKFAKEFLCMEYKVGGVGKLWHFLIPSASNRDFDNGGNFKFC